MATDEPLPEMAPRSYAVVALKTIHTAIFLGELVAILWLVVTGVGGRRDRSVGIAATAVTIESVVFVADAGVCPLTPLTERLGGGRGGVSDIFLPAAVARTIPIWSSALIGLAGLLHLLALASGQSLAERIRTGVRVGR